MKVEVSYALPDEQVILVVEDAVGLTAEQAIHKSGILDKYPEIDLQSNKIGIFGKMKPLTEILREGDRVEIYRPLIADPKEVRRQRAKEGKAMKKGGGELESAG